MIITCYYNLCVWNYVFNNELRKCNSLAYRLPSTQSWVQSMAGTYEIFLIMLTYIGWMIKNYVFSFVVTMWYFTTAFRILSSSCLVMEVLPPSNVTNWQGFSCGVEGSKSLCLSVYFWIDSEKYALKIYNSTPLVPFLLRCTGKSRPNALNLM